MKTFLLVGLIAFACAIRFVGLERSPPGFYIDEAMGGAHSICYHQTGRDLYGQVGIFSKSDAFGFQSAPFLMSSALWSAAFGTGTFGFRSFAAFIGVVTVLGIYRLVRGMTGQVQAGLWAAALAACLPWAFHFSRISWDAPLGTAFLVWAMALIYRSGSPRERDFGAADWAVWACSGLLLAFASYTYSPMRVQAALMVVLLPGVRIKQKLALLAVFGLLNLPVLRYYADPLFTARAKLLAITSTWPGNPYGRGGSLDLIRGYGTNVLIHLSPSFLLLKGDGNLRHSIPSHGMLDFVTGAGLVVGIGSVAWSLRRRERLPPADSLWVRLGPVGILAGISPAALTWEGLPHGVRSLGAWPFFVIFAAYGVTRWIARFPRHWIVVWAAVLGIFLWYLRDYFVKYPGESADLFEAEAVESILKTRVIPERYEAVARAYFQMAYLGERCEDVRAKLPP